MSAVNRIEPIWQVDSTMIYLKYMVIGLIVGAVGTATGSILDRFEAGLQKIRGMPSAEN
jgi:hypothetical protein